MEILDGLKLLLIHHRIECDAYAFSKPNCSYHDLTIVIKGKLTYTVNGETYTVYKYDKTNSSTYRAEISKSTLAQLPIAHSLSSLNLFFSIIFFTQSYSFCVSSLDCVPLECPP